MASEATIDQYTRREVTEKVASTLADYYVDPEVGETMSDALLGALAKHDYDELDTPLAFCERLTSDLQAISNDLHLRVRYNDEPSLVQPPSIEYSPEDIAAFTDMSRRVNHGFYKIERLPGNIGYLDLRNFWDVGWEGAGDTASAAMALLYNTDALIFDLRRNGGGSPTMVAFLISYLVGPEPVHLNSFYLRMTDKTTQSWTQAYVPGKRMADKPVYVLTSKKTFSGAEEFSYNLKNLKRATLVGETTGGGAHPGGDVFVHPHYRVFVPIGRPTNPISGTNWEGVGVLPDIAVPQEEALTVAHRMALETVIAKLGDSPKGSARTQSEEAKAALVEIDSR
ncbi:MAG: S41 family peptidase [Chloroflexia bacterium]